tara:strand:- start:848 stop:3874 length:3027 start_codon:yes stop_codon:yes gene_type:complete
MNYKKLVLSTKEVEKIVKKEYGISGSASKLEGEIDINYKISTRNSQDYILKISRPDSPSDYLDFQIKILKFINSKNNNLPVSKLILNKKKKNITETQDHYGAKRIVRLLKWIPGRVWSSVNPQLDDLRYSLGEKSGNVTKLLKGFDHKIAHREFEWDIAQSLWTKKHLNLFDIDQKKILKYFQEQFELKNNDYTQLRKSVIHNDINDNNIIVSEDLANPSVRSIVDFGDAINTQIINEVGTVCAYGIMNQNDPLDAALPIISGYHSMYPLQEDEIQHLYNVIAMKLVISVTKSAINKTKEPGNKYLLISEKNAWELLNKWYNISPEFATYSFRKSCGFNSHPDYDNFKKWCSKQSISISKLFPSIKKNKLEKIDLSISTKFIEPSEIGDLEVFQYKIEKLQEKFPDKILAGGYLEPRAIYTTDKYGKSGNSGNENRTIHIGLDFWLPAKTPVHAIFDGEVVIATNDAGEKEYGGLVVLKHKTKNFNFFTLYGHNSVKSATQHSVGDKIKQGDKISELGNYPENGNWPPHLHFQIMLSMLDYKIDFPGVMYYNQIDIWKEICPNPNLLFKSKNIKPTKEISDAEIIKYRDRHLGKSLKLHYDDPVRIARGVGQYLMDNKGRLYLDTVNNVAHVGHENPEIVIAGQKQMALLNTNTRYLHEGINNLAEKLLNTLPKELSVCYFVNSGSEANELAIRMVKEVTGQKDIIVSQWGYHGNTNKCIDISSYKFDRKGGKGAPENTHVIPIPDSYRGKYRGANTGDKYSKEVKKCIDNIHSKKRKVGGFIIEPIISCGGQIELPNGFVKKSYDYIRKAGGVCISDEVQVGFGRLGESFWGFELHRVIPDIITIGKPFGNGHPIGAVVCTEEIANKFTNGMEFFNTFGGNPVSCSIATEVLSFIEKNNLQKNALITGGYLKKQLTKLAKKYPIIGDVRGKGLFLGIELTNYKLKPLRDHANYLANRMKQFGILMSTDGPDDNVIKIKPPIIFNKEDCDKLTFYLDKIFKEDFMKFY